MSPREITIETARSLLAYDPETGVFRWQVSRGRTAKAGSVAGSIDTHGHRQIMICGRAYAAHRLAWLFMTGLWPVGPVDHRDGCRDNNRFGNLRGATEAQNRQNSENAVGGSGLPGAVFHKRQGKWNAAIRANGVKRHLGTFDTAEEAHAAYRAASLAEHGQFSRFAR